MWLLHFTEFVDLLEDSSEDRLARTLYCWGSRISVLFIKRKICPNGYLTFVQASNACGKDLLVQWPLWQKR